MIKEADIKEKYIANSVIDGGYKIYDKWKNKKYSSRGIVRSVYLAASLANVDKGREARLDALSHLFALDLRIKERYKTILRLIIFFFAYRRETNALKWLMDQLNLSAYNGDIRSLIEIELERIRKILETEELDGKDNKKRGGKTIAASEEKDARTDASWDELDIKTTDNKKIQIKKSEKKEDDESSLESEYEIHSEENKKREEHIAPSKQANNLNASPKVENVTVNQEKSFKAVTVNQEKINTKKENNILGYESESIADKESKKQEIDGYVDVFPIPNEKKEEKSKEKVSFIDEIILDHLANGIPYFVDNANLNDEGRVKCDASQNADSKNIEAEEARKKTEAYLYDKMVIGMKNEQSSQETRESIKVNIPKNDKENEIRGVVSEMLSEKNILVIKEAKEADARHYIDKYCQEYGKGVNDKNDKNDDHNVQNAPPKIIPGKK